VGVRFVGLRLASARFALALVAIVGLASACESPHLGRPCDLGATPPGATGGARIVTVSSPALECPSRICLGGGASADGAGGLCTASCASDADCEGAESDSRCAQGFACGWPTTFGDFACQKLCVCRDLLPEPQAGFTKPATCP